MANDFDAAVSRAPPTVIFLNGPSSAGKTSIALCLQEQSAVPLLHFSLDDFQNGYFRMLPPGMPAATDDPRKSLRAIAACAEALMAETGHGLIVDAVAFPDAMRIWLESLGRHGPFLVAVTAPLAVLEQREQARGDRQAGMARDQVRIIDETVVYDLLLDTATLTPAEAARAILAAMTDSRSPPAPKLPGGPAI